MLANTHDNENDRHKPVLRVEGSYDDEVSADFEKAIPKTPVKQSTMPT